MVSMCDYSLHNVASRRATAGDKLVTTRFNPFTLGFAAGEDRKVAVCLMPGTEIAFEGEVRIRRMAGLLPALKTGATMARFRRINEGRIDQHHDALEFPDGQVVLLTKLCEGQRATVLQLPAATRPVAAPEHWAEFTAS
jgi:hypothetical protein